MKTKGFKKLSYEEAKLKLKDKPKKKAKLKTKKTTYYKELLDQNKWIKPIPQGSHGSTKEQKKLWKLVSDYIRIRDFTTYGTCISCNQNFDSWKEAQAGHYRPYSKCKGINKFKFQNCFAQCALCNSRMNEDKFEGGRIFAENIIRRHGKLWFETIQTFTEGEIKKVELPEILKEMRFVIGLMDGLIFKPSYYQKCKELDYGI